MDDTNYKLHELTNNYKCIEIIKLKKNLGKAEAIRNGLITINQKKCFIGILDFDFATSADDYIEMYKFCKELKKSENFSLFGSRAKIIENKIIKRSFYRYYPSLILGYLTEKLFRLKIKDIQCGSKIFYFEDFSEIKNILFKPFVDKWYFDLEFVLRLLLEKKINIKSIIEYDLDFWQDVEGSKVKAIDFFLAIKTLLKLKRSYSHIFNQ